MGGDLLACFILVKQDAGIRMRTLSCVGKCLPVHLKPDAERHEIRNYLSGGVNHNMNGIRIVLVMTCLHGILKESIIVFLVTKHTDTALC